MRRHERLDQQQLVVLLALSAEQVGKGAPRALTLPAGPMPVVRDCCGSTPQVDARRIEKGKVFNRPG
jgi:hypothetical protein